MILVAVDRGRGVRILVSRERSTRGRRDRSTKAVIPATRRTATVSPKNRRALEVAASLSRVKREAFLSRIEFRVALRQRSMPIAQNR
jgi:hypothetical protein